MVSARNPRVSGGSRVFLCVCVQAVVGCALGFCFLNSAVTALGPCKVKC